MDIGNSWGKTYKGFINPNVEIKVRDEKLDINMGKKGVCVTNVHVEKSVGCEASICRVLISAIATRKEGYDQPFLEKLPLGSKIEIKLGYSGKLDTVFIGYITGVDLSIHPNKNMTVSITGMDGKVWMMSNNKSELKKEVKKYSEAVKGILKRYSGKFSSESKVKISGEPSHEVSIYQSNESDYQFVCRMAGKCGALFFIDNGKFNFVDMCPSSFGSLFGLGAKEFDNSNISDISTSFNLCGIPKKVEVVAQNLKKFTEAIKGTTTEPKGVGSGKSASGLSRDVNSVMTIIDSTVSSQNEAEFASQAVQNRKNFNLVNLKVELTNGIPNLELGKIYKIEGMSKIIDNKYILVKIKHDMLDGRYTSTAYLSAAKSKLA